MLLSLFPAIIARSKGKTTAAIERCNARMVDIAKERSRVASGEMRDGWEDTMLSWDEGFVFNMVAHTGYNEYGTTNMSAQPMLRPAAEIAYKEMQDDLHGIYKF